MKRSDGQHTCAENLFVFVKWHGTFTCLGSVTTFLAQETGNGVVSRRL